MFSFCCDRCLILRGLTPLHCASREGKVEVMRTLLSSDADVNATNPDGGTSLHAASHWGKVNAVKFLLQKNAMFTENADGFSAMYYACKNGHVDVMEALIGNYKISIFYQCRNTIEIISIKDGDFLDLMMYFIE